MVIVELYIYMCTYSTKKIIGMCNRGDRVAQTRELECTKTVEVARGEFHMSGTTSANNTFR